MIALGWFLLLRNGRFLGIQQDLLLRIMDIVHASGMVVAFPSQTLHIADSQAPGSDAQAASSSQTPSIASLHTRKPV